MVKLHFGLMSLKDLFLALDLYSDLSDDLSSNPKLLAENTSLFLVVRNKNLTAKYLNNHFRLMRIWARQWKMSFKPDSLK